MTTMSWLTPWSRVILEKLTGSQLVKKFPAFYGTRKFIAAFTTDRDLSLSWARSVQYKLPSHILKIHLILSSHLRIDLTSGLFPSGNSTKTLNAPLLSPHSVICPAHLSAYTWENMQVLKFFFFTFLYLIVTLKKSSALLPSEGK